MIGIINYGLGNVRAFVNILRSLNQDYCLIDEGKNLPSISKIILPGVGAFDNAISLIKAKKLFEPLNDLVINQGIPILGVCVGMQIMATTSTEGQLNGFGWIDHEIKKFNYHSKFVVPHMGWNDVEINNEIEIFKNINEKKFYFLHSYYFSKDISTNELISSHTYYGINFVSAFKLKNIYGVQFHPEKSHKSGEKLIENFCKIK